MIGENKNKILRILGNLRGVLLVLLAVGCGQLVFAQNQDSSLESEFLLQLTLELAGEPVSAGHTTIASIGSGSFSGPKLKGTVLAGGADWMTQVSGHSALDVRISLLTDDGAYIYMHYTGMIYEGESGAYWRVTPSFQTASEKYNWLNHLVTVGTGSFVDGAVAYDIFSIL